MIEAMSKVQIFIGTEMLRKGFTDKNLDLMRDGLMYLFPNKFQNEEFDEAMMEIKRVYRTDFGFVVPKWEIDGNFLGSYCDMGNNGYMWFWNQ